MKASLVQLRSEYCCALHATVTWALHVHSPHCSQSEPRALDELGSTQSFPGH